MATPTLDISLLGYFSPVLSFLLIWVLVYATLQYTRMLGENKIIHGAIAFLIGSFFLFAPEASGVITFIAPWFAVLFIMSIFMIIGFKVFGATDSQIKGVITNWGPAQWTIGIIGILIIIGGFSSVYGKQFLGFTGDDQPMLPSNQNPTAGSTASGDFEQNVAGVFFHPKILGTVFILIVVAVAIKMLSGDMKPDWPIR